MTALDTGYESKASLWDDICKSAQEEMENDEIWQLISKQTAQSEYAYDIYKL